MINIIRIIIRHKDVFALILVLILSLFLLFSNNKNPSIINLKSQLTSSYSKILSPIQWYQNTINLKNENAFLEEVVAKLNLQNTKFQLFEEENIRLKKMLGYKGNSSFDLGVANVINHNLSSDLNSFVLDAGSENNIGINLPVIDMNGIIGKTYIVSEQKTIVQLITDKNFRISIRIGKNRNLGIFVPKYSKIGIIEGIPKSQEVLIDEIVITSGISDIYPADIPIAKVISTYIDTNELFQNITVEILADIFNPDYVFIIE